MGDSACAEVMTDLGTETAILVAFAGCLEQRGSSVADVQRALREAGLQVGALAFEPTLPPDELARLALAAGATMIVAAGGDGTVHAAANAAAQLGLTLAVLPFGTANDFAHGLALPLELAAAVAAIAAGQTRTIDLGRVNGHYFLTAAHAGLGAETARRSDPRLKQLVGPLAYAVAAVGAWSEHEPLELTLVVNGREATLCASQLLVANGVYYGGGNLVAPDASFDDGQLEIQLVGPDLPAHALLRLAGALRRGEMADQPETACFRTTHLEVTLGRPAPVNMDGELVELGEHLVFEVAPRALRVVVAKA